MELGVGEISSAFGAVNGMDSVECRSKLAQFTFPFFENSFLSTGYWAIEIWLEIMFR